MALRSHCRPKTSRSAPTTRRRAFSGSSGERRAEDGDDDGEDDQRRAPTPMQGRAPVAGGARGEHDGRRLDRLDGAGEEDGEENGPSGSRAAPPARTHVVRLTRGADAWNVWDNTRCALSPVTPARARATTPGTRLAAARLSRSLRAHPPARRGVAAPEGPGIDLSAELRRGAARGHPPGAGAAQAAHGDPGDGRHGDSVRLRRAAGRGRSARRVPERSDDEYEEIVDRCEDFLRG